MTAFLAPSRQFTIADLAAPEQSLRIGKQA
jgi:hypothetical protein